MHHPTKVFLLTGSNIEPRAGYLKKAEREIGEQLGDIVKRTTIYESQPWGFRAENNFLNRVLEVETMLSAGDALQIILDIETKLGRKREGNKYSSRTIDIDILYFGSEMITEKNLQVPHPRLHTRRFTLMPLVEIAPDLEHPGLKKTNRELLHLVNDDLEVWKYTGAC